MAPSESYHALLSRVSEEIDDPEQIFGLKNDTAANTARLNVRKVLVTAFHSSLWVLTVAIAILIIFISKSKPTIQQCNEQVSLWCKSSFYTNTILI